MVKKKSQCYELWSFGAVWQLLPSGQWRGVIAPPTTSMSISLRSFIGLSRSVKIFNKNWIWSFICFFNYPIIWNILYFIHFVILQLYWPLKEEADFGNLTLARPRKHTFSFHHCCPKKGPYPFIKMLVLFHKVMVLLIF